MKISELRITTICENTSSHIFKLGEWGISFFIETGEEKILFDTGGGNTLLHNATTMGLDLAGVDKAALSHGHKDHTGGLKSFLQRVQSTTPGRKVKIYTHPRVFDAKYIKDDKGNIFYIGMGYVHEELKFLGAEFVMQKDSVEISSDIFISGEIDQDNDFEVVSEKLLCKDENGDIVPDPLVDDQALFIKTEKGLIIVSGCAHRGIINTIKQGQRVTGQNEVFMVIGGTHLEGAGEEQFEYTVDELKKLGVKKLGVSHCTGLKKASRLHSIFGDDVFFYNNAGTLIDFTNQDYF